MSSRTAYSSVPTDIGDHLASAEAVKHLAFPVSGEDSPQQHAVRKWTSFPGKNNFYCDGRIIAGRNQSLFYFTIVLIVVTNVLFLTFE
jgi:hypothetical protein